MSNAKVLFDYEAEADDELSLAEGDLIRDIVKKEDGWWEGELHGKRGMFPENFVEEISKNVVAETKSTEMKPTPAAPVVNEKNTLAKVTFDYDAENDDELTLKEGDVVKVLDQEEEGWWKGELNGNIGVFPSNFVEVIKGPEPEPPVPKQPEPPKESEKKPKIIGGMKLPTVSLDVLTQTKDKLKNRDGISSGGNQKPERPAVVPSEINKRTSVKRPPKIPEPDRPPKVASKGKEKVLVEFDYDGEQSDELTLHVGDIVTVLEKDVNEGWSKGELNGKIGLFPDNFVKILPPEPSRESEMTKNLPKRPSMPLDDDVDAKPSRPEFPKLRKTNPDRAPLQSSVSQSELQAKLKAVVPPPDDATKKSEPPPLPDSKPANVDERSKPPIKRSPPLLPKKPGKPKPQDLPINSDRPPLRHVNGVDPSKRHSTAPLPSEKNHDADLKRRSIGTDLGVNLNDIKSSAVLQPLTSDRPKNPSKHPPTKYGKPSSPVKKSVTPEIPQSSWPPKEPEKIKKPEKPPAAEKPPKPAIPETTKPGKPVESKVDSGEIKKLHEEINTLKSSLESMMKQFKEHVQKSEKNLQKMEKKFTDEIEDLTRELDEEKKLRSAVDVEVNRLRKLIKNQISS
ncbi:CD2-associated protein-like isoform X2 [Dendronephthya gigantea]|uniref:CD2-associated protein-like isoform X2 n=1 Tax=Dendronephthya gigantea TaxID=151771 RepID=UPI00106A6EA9|nr:CD2-associated protein-like isoform X2 [Dendronephthya gigantea]